ncbi:MAG: phage head closure protein [Betaproteobacteria bacterium]
MTVINASQLTKRIKLQRQSTSQDSFGGPVRTWLDVATIWAEIRPVDGREQKRLQRIASEVSHQITVRFQARLTDTRVVSAYRALYKARIFNIHAVLNEDESNVLITLLASEGLE